MYSVGYESDPTTAQKSKTSKNIKLSVGTTSPSQKMGKSTRSITRGLNTLNKIEEEQEHEKHSDEHERASINLSTIKKKKESSSMTKGKPSQLELTSQQSVLAPKFGETQGSGSTIMQQGFGLAKKKEKEPKIDDDPRVVEMCEKIFELLMDSKPENKSKNERALRELGFMLDKDQLNALKDFQKSYNIVPDEKKQLKNKVKIKFIRTHATNIRGFVVAKIKKQDLDNLVNNEIEEFQKEQSEARSKELRIKMAKFLLEKQQENDILNYVIEEEAYKSQEGFNVFDQMAQGITDQEISGRLKHNFKELLESKRE